MEEKTQAEINKEIHNALYGGNGELGLINKVNEVWELLSAFRLFGKAIMWIAIVLGSIGAAWAAFWPSFKHFITGK